MATSNDFSTLDFETITQNLKTYLKDQDLFQDYDFEGSNINVLLDVLAYNTSLNAFYLNMIGNEMFLDSALKRDSIVSHAKELNYVPRSFRSSIATVDITLTDSASSEDATILLPRGTTFTGSVGGSNFTFSLPENIQAFSTNTLNVFKATDVIIYEGDYVSDTYITNTQNQPRFIVSNKTADTNSIRVTVVEDNGATALSYVKRDSLFGLSDVDKVFFLQAAEDDTYEILFGDGVIGRPPKNNSIVIIEYRACNGELPNGIRKFKANDDVGTAIITSVETTSPATGGSIPESLSSIKFNAPRAFTTQERVVTAGDYSTLLKANFSEINDVIAYGGEEYDPPLFGKVVIAVDLKNTDELPASFRSKYGEFIKPRAPLGIDPIFVQPDYTYISLVTKVRYDINKTSLNIDDIKSLTLSAIQTYNEEDLNGFGKTLRYSKLLSAIDSSQESIVSNDTTVRATKFLSLNSERSNYELSFDLKLRSDIGQKTNDHRSEQLSVVSSTAFIFQGDECFIEDDGLGILNIIKVNNGLHEIITNVGTVLYDRGLLILDNVAFTSVFNGFLRISVLPEDLDIAAQKRTILRTLDEDILVTVEQVRL